MDATRSACALASALILSGCLSPAQIAANRLAEQQQAEAERAAYRQQVIRTCESYGFTTAHPNFSQCLMQVDQANQQRQAAAINAILPALILQQPRPAYQVPPPQIRQPAQTSCERTYGGGFNCTTY